jgi:hypothetical protein
MKTRLESADDVVHYLRHECHKTDKEILVICRKAETVGFVLHSLGIDRDPDISSVLGVLSLAYIYAHEEKDATPN